MGFVGRTREIDDLDRLQHSRKSEFVAVYGRRRVGKTFLIREYFNYQFDFQLTGLANANTKQQLTNFSTALSAHSLATDVSFPENWFTAFQQLISYLEQIKDQRKKVVFLDELPWLDTARSDFMVSLEHFWNSWATNRKDIILIGCGSAAAWMINKLINQKGGLHNRITSRIKMNPFDLKETEQMLRAKGNVLDRYQILLLYMVTGGIPFYLDAISPDKSAAQNIEALCFTKGALLTTEFNNLILSLFSHPEAYEKIIKALAIKAKGITRNELLRLTGLPSGGTLTRQMMELEESGFVSKYVPFNKKSRDTLYRLADFYSIFYFKFIKDNNSYDQGIWINAIESPAQRAWSGYAFEQICLTHLHQLKKALGISGIVSHSSSWISTHTDPGAQIDLVIDRKDQVINLCEMKFSIHPFTISKSYAGQLRNKIGAFRQESKTRKALFLTMITTYGLVRNQHSTSLVQNEITMDALFE